MKNIIFNNIGTKISALLIAVFLWFFVTSQGQSELTVDAPIEFKNIPAKLGIVSSGSKTVALTIRGQERFMKSLNTSDIRVYIDMRKAIQGEAEYPVNKDDIKLPFAMTITNAVPSAVKVKLEEMVSKAVPVQPQILGMPGHKNMISVSVEPKTVIITGLKSEVRRISFLKTEELDVSDLNRNITEELELRTNGMNIKPNPAKVKVNISITEKKR